MKNELILKEKNQPSVNIDSFNGIVSVEKLQTIIQQGLCENDELYFVDEIEKIVCEIGDTAVKNHYQILTKKYQTLKKKEKEHQDFIDNFNEKYYKKKEEIKQTRKEMIIVLCKEQKSKSEELIEKCRKEEITQEQLKNLMLSNEEFYNEKINQIKNFKDIDGIDLKTETITNQLEVLVYNKLTSDFFTNAEWEERKTKEHELEVFKKEILLINEFIAKLSYVDFSSNISEFANLFTKESFEKIDIATNVKKIKSNLNKLKIVLLPVALTQEISNDMVLKVIGKLIINTKFYGKKDDNIIAKNTSSLKEDLEEFSFYAIKRGIKEYCKKNKDYPASKELIDAIQPKHDKGLILFANIQFLLSL